MRLLRSMLVSGLFLALAACGDVSVPKAPLTAQQVLTQQPEFLEFESVGTRQELFREIARTALAEQGQSAESAVLFPMSQGSSTELIAAPGFDPRADLLSASDAGSLLLEFDRSGEQWPTERRESLGGLSEREAAELVARSLLAHWSASPPAEIQVDRATSAPYAVAYVDGILRINPAFLYLVAATPAGGAGQP